MNYVLTPEHWSLVMDGIIAAGADDWPTKPRVLWQQADQSTGSGGPTGVMIAFYLPGQVGQELVGLGAALPADSMHVTVAFLADNAEALSRSGKVGNLQKAVAGWARLTSPMAAHLNGIGVFNPGPQSDTPVTYANVDCPDLAAARHALIESLVGSGLEVDASHGFTPHATLAYGDLSGQIERPDLMVSLDTVTVAIGPARMGFKLGGVGSRLS